MEEESYLKICASSGSPCTEMTRTCTDCQGIVALESWERELARTPSLTLSAGIRASDRRSDAEGRTRS